MLKKADKIELTKVLVNELKESNGFVICSFQGLTVSAVNILRRRMFGVNAKAQVIKNRLLKHALHESNIVSMDNLLTGSTMIILGKEDAMEALRVLGVFVKEHPELGFKAGILSQVEYSQEEIVEISKLPGRVEIIAMVAGGLNSVLSVFNSTIEALALKKESIPS